MRPEEYRKMAEVEDMMWYYRALHRHIVSGLERSLGSGAVRLIDVGCGTGGLLRRLAAAHPDWRCTGVDASPLAVKLARERTRADITTGDAARLPAGDGTVDAITCADVLYQVEDPAAVLAEFRRVLRPDGVAVVVAPAYQWLWSYHDEAVQSKRRFSRPELVRLLAAAGFRLEIATYLNLFVFPLVVLRRKVFPPREPTSDVRLYPRPVEWGFLLMARVEHAVLRIGLRLPFGSSVLVVARRAG